jgi:hypothetical protein
MSATGATGPAPTVVNDEPGKWPTVSEFEVGAGTLANRSARIFGNGATKITAAVTLPANKADDLGNKSDLRSAKTGIETGIAAELATQPSTADEADRAQSEQQPVPYVSQVGGDAENGLRKPTPIPPKFENFPPELKSLLNWVLWRFLPPKSPAGKWRKVPCRPNGKPAVTTDRSTWSGFDECCAAYNRGGFDGVGFVFDGMIGTDGLCYCGVDFDDCVSDGVVQSPARNRIEHLNTYTELSVSGTGIHCIARAEPLDRPVKFDGVEVYTTARYFTFTGVRRERD